MNSSNSSTDIDSLYMQKTLDLAKTLLGNSKDVPIAAMICKDDELIATGINTRERDQSVTGHAEINAIEEATKKLGSWNLSGCTIYISLEPCPMCTGAILQSHISKVVFGAYDSKTGALGSRYDLRTKNLEVKGGILEEESLQLLKDFFGKLRA